MTGIKPRRIKVAMSGAQSTGKTTAARALTAWAAAEYPDLKVALMPEVARACPWPVNEGTSPEGQRWIYHRQICDELEAGREADILICDRSALDNLVYSQWARRGSADKNAWKWVFEYLAWFENDWLPTYDMVWFFEVDRSRVIEDDGFRSVSRVFQRDIDALFKETRLGISDEAGFWKIFNWMGLDVACRELAALVGGGRLDPAGLEMEEALND